MVDETLKEALRLAGNSLDTANIINKFLIKIIAILAIGLVISVIAIVALLA